MTHVPSDDERRSLYLGLKERGYDNETRAKLTWTPPTNVELPDAAPADHIMAMYADLFQVPDVQLFHPGMEPQPRGERCPIEQWHTENCPPFQEVKMRTMPLVPPDDIRCRATTKYDGVAIRCEAKLEHEKYLVTEDADLADLRHRFDTNTLTLQWNDYDEDLVITIHE